MTRNISGQRLRNQIAMLPTPRVSDTEGAPVTNAECINGSWSRENKDGVRWGVKVKDVLFSLHQGIIVTIHKTGLFRTGLPPVMDEEEAFWALKNNPLTRHIIRNLKRL